MTEKKADYIADVSEMMGWNEPKQIITEISGWVPLFDCVLIETGNLTKTAVHGAMWRFCQMEDKVCKASLSTIGEMIGVDKATVNRYAKELCNDGYFIDLTPELRNKPHVYADTGKVRMRNRFDVAQNNTGVAQNNATVAQDRLNKVLNKDSNKDTGANAPLPLDWQIATNQPIQLPEKEKQFDIDADDAAYLLAQGSNADLKPLALAFMKTRRLLPALTDKEMRSWRKAFRDMKSARPNPVQANHVEQAIKNLLSKNMTVSSPYSVINTAKDLANPAPEASGYNPQGLVINA